MQPDLYFAGEAMIIDPDGGLYLPARQMLVVSDLHLEKGSFLAQFGSALPRYDTRDTLMRLRLLIARYSPTQLVCLGDSFHDCKAYGRLEDEDKQMLCALVASVPVWHWVLGNHDPAMPCQLPGLAHEKIHLGNMVLLHEPEENDLPQIVGHFHPKLRLRIGGQRVSGRALCYDDRLLIMPSFGSYTGGLDVHDEAIASRLSSPRYHLFYRNRVWKIP